MSLLKESLALMPGHAREHWNLRDKSTSRALEETKMSPVERWQKLIVDFDKTQDYATAKKLMTQIKRLTQKLMVDDPLRKGMRHYMNAETLRYGKLRKLKAKAESVAGEPGEFAVTEPGEDLQDALDDVRDRCKRDYWSYPDWTLPRGKLDED